MKEKILATLIVDEHGDLALHFGELIGYAPSNGLIFELFKMLNSTIKESEHKEFIVDAKDLKEEVKAAYNFDDIMKKKEMRGPQKKSAPS